MTFCSEAAGHIITATTIEDSVTRSSNENPV